MRVSLLGLQNIKRGLYVVQEETKSRCAGMREGNIKRERVKVSIISTYYPLLGSCYVYFSTINQLPTQEGVKVRISTVVRANN